MKRLRIILFLSMGILISAEERLLKIQFQAGSHYQQQTRYAGLKLQLSPQIVFWIEDPSGDYLGTLYMTYKAAKAAWGPGIRRPDVFPVWSYRRNLITSGKDYRMPTKGMSIPDALTGATPPGSFIREWTVPPELYGRKVAIYAEINISFDYNEIYKKNLSKKSPYFNAYNGQPSVIWKGEMVLAGSGESRLTIAGCSDPRGRNGTIHPGLQDLTTALQLAESIVITLVSR
jgi:hypothetical protein